MNRKFVSPCDHVSVISSKSITGTDFTRKQLAAIDWNYQLDRMVAVGSKGGDAR